MVDSFPHIKVGNVISKDMHPKISNKTWPLGPVTVVLPGKDGLARVVTISMHEKLFQQPINMEDLTGCSRPAPPPLEDVGDSQQQAHGARCPGLRQRQ